MKIPGLALLHQKGRNWDTGTRETDSKVQGRDKGNLIKKQWQEHSATDKELNRFIIGRVNYFNLADMINLAKALDGWIRRRLRMCIWKQWWKVKTKHDNLTKLGIANTKAWECANTRKGYWRISNSPILSHTLTNEHLTKLGLVSLTKRYSLAR